MSERDSQGSERQRAFEEIEVAINDLDSVQAEEVVRDALKDLPGIRSVRLVRGGAMIAYNPDGIDPKQICDAIGRAGFTVDGVEGGRVSPHPREEGPEHEQRSTSSAAKHPLHRAP